MAHGFICNFPWQKTAAKQKLIENRIVFTLHVQSMLVQHQQQQFASPDFIDWKNVGVCSPSNRHTHDIYYWVIENSVEIGNNKT